MKYTPAQYAAALAEVLQGKTSAELKHIAANLFTHMTKARATKDIDRVVREAGRRMRRKEEISAADVESAAPLSAKHLHSIKRMLGPKSAIIEKVNPHLLAGTRIIIDEETLIDATALRRLTTLFP
ncbi:MAG: hypothetical protein A3J10_01055 [Candidatus Sungbacteria bacterium RIFCSPLOWO2_02_FULL_54_10]|uniref:Uncharacterized protein n=2 Tax=Candidatus Sungiibacteriota TaxID=1817917 RepID=A0A1G2L747_9BACT|nr:MAG: hypothetical protein A2679_00630 [Candidatus Sungbacteria bacterium RIFCSPHIGHO2_01_FULL_54_26]OHA04117.1 MAG: hypothetical protein A3C92_04090 [Candidatus Sungbacteria bacterium RIFCSPHIGHO2_02_FULL_53_17]OHA07364.1 MAG: hypothetical protein A3B34_02830 [Candidatus Sungbacteria bacterium RIFCSPLOWO2_01_FULL_54_21]OHA12705.1 MAG: hypothetical protein A3J10_01055 [Candidatus Sungbacteria bacterium RIFCSPLOWO2_02_FULL_54_10]